MARLAKSIKVLKIKTLDHAELEDRRSGGISKLIEKNLRSVTYVVAAAPNADDVEESSSNAVDLMEVRKEWL